MAPKRQLYETLGILRSSSDLDIRSAYKRRALETHPDKGGDHNSFLKVRSRCSAAISMVGDLFYRMFGEGGSVSQSVKAGFAMFIPLFCATLEDSVWAAKTPTHDCLI